MGDSQRRYLAQEGALLLLTGHQVSPPETQLSHQPLQVAHIHAAHTAICFHTGCQASRAGQGLTLEGDKGSVLLSHRSGDPRR